MRLETPIAHSRPRWRRIAYQQLIAPIRDRSSTMLVCPGDQAPLWGSARVVLAINDLRRLVQPETAEPLERLFYRVVQPASVRRANVIVTLTEFMAAELQRRLAPSAPVVVAAAHPVAPAARAAPEPPGRDVVMVGALRSYKGVEDAIEALALVDEALVHHLVLIGSDEQRGAAIRAHAAAHGVGDRVRLCGWVSEDELEHRYRTALAVIAASHYEGYGLPVAEALVRGVPVIASRIPPHVELAADAALWFEPGDVEGLARALHDVASDAQRREELVSRARARGDELVRERRGWAWAIAEALR